MERETGLSLSFQNVVCASVILLRVVIRAAYWKGALLNHNDDHKKYQSLKDYNRSRAFTHCGAILADIFPRRSWSERTERWITILWMRTRRRAPIIRVPHSPTFLGTITAGKEAQTESQTSDPEGAKHLSWPWNSGPALCPCRAGGGVMGVCPVYMCLWTVMQ